MGSVNTILQANNTTRVARAQYRSKVAQTQNTNKLEAAKVGFSDWMRSFGNKARVTAASKEYNFKMEQLTDELRATQGASFNAQVQLAAARGALAAQGGYVGVGGSSADLMDTMIGLQAEMDLETRENARMLLASRGAKQTAQIMSEAYNGMDMGRTFGQFDYSQHIEPKAMKRRLGKLIGVAVATYFGGPQAGEAVADFAVGTWQADNGNFGGASSSFDSSIQNGFAAYQQWGQRGGKSWASSAFGNNSGGARVTQMGSQDWGAFTPNTGGFGWDSGGGNGYW